MEEEEQDLHPLYMEAFNKLTNEELLSFRLQVPPEWLETFDLLVRDLNELYPDRGKHFFSEPDPV